MLGPHAAYSSTRRDRARPRTLVCDLQRRWKGDRTTHHHCFMLSRDWTAWRVSRGGWKSGAIVLLGLLPISSEGAHHDRKIGRNPTVAAESGIADPVGSLFQSGYGRGERLIHRRRSLHGRDVFGPLAKYSDLRRAAAAANLVNRIARVQGPVESN